MPDYIYKLKNGRELVLKGGTAPSDEEVESIAAERGLELLPASEVTPRIPRALPARTSELEIPGEESQDSILSKAYDVLFNAPKFVTEPASRLAETITEPKLDESPLVAMGKGFAGGAIEGVASLLSPANILTLGRGRLPQLASRIIGGTGIAHGAEELVSGDTTEGLGDIAIGALMAAAPGMARLPKIADDIITPPGRSPNLELITSLADRPDLVPVGSEDIFNISRPKPTPSGLPEETIYRNATGRFNMGRTSPESQFDPTTLQGLEEAPSIMQDVSKLESSPSRRSLSLGKSGDLPLVERLASETGEAKSPINKTPEVLAGDLEKNNNIAKFASETQKKSLWGEVRDANRALLTSFDFSAPGRQGKPLMMTKAYWTSFDDMFKSWGSERAYKNVMESIEKSPAFIKPTVDGNPGKSLAERAGLVVGGKEETFRSSFAERLIPGVKRSERAYSAFLNKLRADHFNTMVNDARRMGMNPDTDDVVLKELGSFINDATGRGSLGQLEKIAPVMSEVFFAPKLMASRVNMYKRWLNPKTYGNSNPVVRKQALKSLLSTVGFGTAVGELARLAGAQVSNDPASSDFRKIKLGDKTRIDPFSGFQQYAVGASRLLSGKLTSSGSGRTFDLASGRFGMPSRASVASQFFQNKLAPIPSLIWSWMEGKDWDGEPFEIKKALLDRTIPIVMQDLYELSQEDPDILGGVNPMVLGILPMMGEGIQTYGR